MTETSFKSVTALVLGLTGGKVISLASERPILVFPEQHGVVHLKIGLALDWTVDGMRKMSFVVTEPQRWRQGEVFVRISECEPTP